MAQPNTNQQKNAATDKEITDGDLDAAAGGAIDIGGVAKNNAGRHSAHKPRPRRAPAADAERTKRRWLPATNTPKNHLAGPTAR